MSSLVRASAWMAAGTSFSRVLGFVKAILLVAAIGQTGSLSGDAFANGNFLPNAIYVLLLGGMLSSVLVPEIVRAAQDPDGGNQYVNKILTLVIVALILITLFALTLAPVLVRLFALSWGDEQLALATAFAYWCIPQIFFYGLFTVLGEVLNARKTYAPFAWAPVLNNLVGISGILVFMFLYGTDPDGTRLPQDWTGIGIAILAGTSTLGVASQALVLLLAWHRAGIRFRPDFRWRGMGLGHTIRIASWSFATIVVMQLGGIVTTNVANSASGAGPSSLALQNAWLVVMLPHSILAVSIGTAYFTRFAESAKQFDFTRMKQDISASARSIMIVMIYASGVIFAAAPYVSRVLQPGASLDLVAEFSVVLRTYVIGLTFYSLLFVAQRAFYALSDTRTPFWFTTVQILLFAAGSVACLALDPEIRGAGLALVFSVTTMIQLLLAVWLLRRKIGSIDGKRLAASFGLSAIAGLTSTAVVTSLVHLVNEAIGDFSFLSALLFAALAALVFAALFLGMLVLVRSRDVRSTFAALRASLRRRT